MNALVTGGGGFLGKRIVEMLLEDGHEVRFLARGRYPDVEALGATGFQVDLHDGGALAPVLEGVDTVFHVAAKAGFWGPRSEYFNTNVTGTSNLLSAAKATGVKRFIYTSTPSVLGYDHDVENGGPELPIATRHQSYYPETKAIAETEVRAANAPGFATVALRPHLIFGPGDLQLMPRVVERARQGKLMIVGDGTNKVDLTYIDNAAGAHLDACTALTDHTSACAGKAYFISNDEPVALWPWINTLLGGLDLPPVTRRVPLPLAQALGFTLETAWKWFGFTGEPRMTRFLANGFARAHWYDMGPAKRDFGYQVRVGMEEATRRTVDFLRTR
jgi:nucleoside-diphosphate-sugar epimerase